MSSNAHNENEIVAAQPMTEAVSVERQPEYAVDRHRSVTKADRRFTESADRELLDATAKMAQVGGWELDRATSHVRWTRETFRIHELPPIAVPDLKEALEYYFPEDRQVLQDAIASAMDCGEPFDLELRVTTAKNNIRHVRALCSPIVEDGRTVKLRGTIQDITSRKTMELALLESETRYREIFENNAAIKLVIDPQNGRIVETNTAAANFYGYSSERLKQLSIQDINVAPAEAINRKLIAARDRRVSELEFQHRLASGEIRDVKVYTGPVHIDGETLVHTIIFDITERKRAEEALRRMDQLESLGTLAGGIAHDFNNVLTAIFGNLSLAQTQLTTDHPASQFLQNTERAVSRATGLSQQLLTFSKGGNPIRENVGIKGLVTSVVNFDLAGSNVRADCTFEDNVHDVHVDRGQLSQVLSNLTLNADQAMPDGGTIHISVRNTKLSGNELPGLAEGEYVVVTFRDEGVGICDADLSRVFEPYFSTKANGSGLGLATSFSIVKRHGGFMDVSSKLNQGTTFMILLPAAVPSSEPDVSPSGSIGPPRLRSPTGRRVLVLDDEEAIRNLLSRMLKMMGADVCACRSTADAVAAYRTQLEQHHPFDMAILDLTIPGEPGGCEAARQILEFDPQACLICSSGYTEGRVMAEFRRFGFSGVIPKPYTLADLRSVLESFARRVDDNPSLDCR